MANVPVPNSGLRTRDSAQFTPSVVEGPLERSKIYITHLWWLDKLTRLGAKQLRFTLIFEIADPPGEPLIWEQEGCLSTLNSKGEVTWAPARSTWSPGGMKKAMSRINPAMHDRVLNGLLTKAGITKQNFMTPMTKLTFEIRTNPSSQEVVEI